MKLVRFRREGEIAIGVLLDQDIVVDLAAASGGDTQRFPASMSQFLARGEAGRQDAAEVSSHASGDATYPLSSVTLLSPVGDPPKIMCIGQNYRDHCEEQNQPIPPRIILFAKFTTALNDPDGVIFLPKVAEKVDYEAELAFVIGGKGGGRNIPESEALQHVAGYTCANDVSARDIQQHPDEKQWIRGKSPDSFFPIGPWIVTSDEIEDPHTLDISLLLNGERRQNSNTSNLIFKIPFIIAHLSKTMTLQPGDIVATGTPGGVGIYSNPPVVLKPGDTVSVTIQKIGTLTNTVEQGE